MEVEPDLPHRHDPGVSGEHDQLVPIGGRGRGGVVRMHAHRRVDQPGVRLRQLDRRARGGEVVAGHQDALDPRLHGAGDDRLAIGVEGGVLEVAVRVDQAGQVGRRAVAAQGAAPASAGSSAGSSTRGKSGRASPVVQPSGTAPQASSCSRPGPPLPRPSYGAGTPSWACRVAAADGVNGAIRWPRMRHASAHGGQDRANARRVPLLVAGPRRL